jgi:hypothetical protein
MRKRKEQKYFLFYSIKDIDKKIVYSERNCKIPEFTREYKKMQFWLNSSFVESIGYCTLDYFEDYKYKFI